MRMKMWKKKKWETDQCFSNINVNTSYLEIMLNANSDFIEVRCCISNKLLSDAISVGPPATFQIVKTSKICACEISGQPKKIKKKKKKKERLRVESNISLKPLFEGIKKELKVGPISEDPGSVLIMLSLLASLQQLQVFPSNLKTIAFQDRICSLQHVYFSDQFRESWLIQCFLF